MKKITIVMALVAVFVAASAVAANVVTDLTDEIQFNNLISSNTVAAIHTFRPGGSWEISASGASNIMSGGLTWVVGEINSIESSYDLAGNAEIAVTPYGSTVPVVAYNRPTVWFDTILISSELKDDGFINSFSLTHNVIDGDGFTESLSDMIFSENGWDGIMIQLGGYNADKQGPLTISMDLSVNTFLSQTPGSDDFQGQIVFLQTGVVPEPASIALIAIGGLSVLVLRRVQRPRC